MPKFKTAITQAEDMNATGINVPEAIVEQLGAGKKPKVSVTLEGYTYQFHRQVDYRDLNRK